RARQLRGGRGIHRLEIGKVTRGEVQQVPDAALETGEVGPRHIGLRLRDARLAARRVAFGREPDQLFVVGGPQLLQSASLRNRAHAEWTPPPVILLSGINVTFATLPSRSAEDHSPGAGRGDRARPGSPGNASSGAGAPARERHAADLARARRAPSAAKARRSGAGLPARAT